MKNFFPIGGARKHRKRNPMECFSQKTQAEAFLFDSLYRGSTISFHGTIGEVRSDVTALKPERPVYIDGCFSRHDNLFAVPPKDGGMTLVSAPSQGGLRLHHVPRAFWKMTVDSKIS